MAENLDLTEDTSPEPELLPRTEFQSLMPYMGVKLGELTVQEEQFAQYVVSGMTLGAAGRAVGIKTLTAAKKIASKEAVVKAIDYFRNQFADEVQFGMTQAHGMYIQTWANCANATEMKNTVYSLVKLHGLAAPAPKTQVNIQVNGTKQLERMTDEDLLQLAGVEKDYLEPK